LPGNNGHHCKLIYVAGQGIYAEDQVDLSEAKLGKVTVKAKEIHRLPDYAGEVSAVPAGYP
jgi:hypothetical protein